jgi:hypothetical protein
MRRRSGLRMAHQNFHPQNLGQITFKVLIHYIQACATTPDATCALRPPRECDRSREQMRLAPRAAHYLAALLHSVSLCGKMPARTDVRDGRAFKEFIRQI